MTIHLRITAIAAIAICLAAGASSYAQDDADANPLLDIVSDMNSAATQLGKLHTGKPTQAPQRSALNKLDALIKELERQQAASKGGSVNPNPSKPAADSVIRSGPGGMGKLHAERRDGKQWGELPAKERERILQSLEEGFPSHYQKILERYFARLADEKALPDAEPPAESAAPTSDSGSSPGDSSAKVAPAKDQP
jgi:hypothetical protein